MAKGRKTGGRVKGTPNKSTGLVAERCRQWLESPEYQASFQQRLLNKELAPALEAMAWHYAYFKPTERMEVSGPDGGPIEVHDHFVAAAQ